MLKDRDDWPDPREPKSVLLEELEHAAQELPGSNYEFTQPIQMRTNELLSGVRADVAVKVYGDELSILARIADRVEAIARTIEGAADVRAEQTSGLPMLVITPDRRALARYGLNPEQVQVTVTTAVGGSVAGQLIEGDRRFDIVVRLPESLRTDIQRLGDLSVPLPSHEDADEASLAASWHSGEPRFLPLLEVARIE